MAAVHVGGKLQCFGGHTCRLTYSLIKGPLLAEVKLECVMLEAALSDQAAYGMV